jgi:hypothetical protein
MARKVFIAATGQNCGKTTTSLSLMHLARKKYDRVGFIKPLGPKLINYKGRAVDMDAALIAKVYGLDEDIELMSPVLWHLVKPPSGRQSQLAQGSGRLDVANIRLGLQPAVQRAVARQLKRHVPENARPVAGRLADQPLDPVRWRPHIRSDFVNQCGRLAELVRPRQPAPRIVCAWALGIVDGSHADPVERRRLALRTRLRRRMEPLIL